jgi:CSLREA domain-containing protein
MVLMCASLLFCATRAARAANFTVNQAGDAGDGICDATCTLRDAVIAANNVASDDVITFDASLTTITLVNAEIAITNNGSLIINGLGADVLTVDGGAGTNRIFFIDQNAVVNITDITLTGGNGAGADAGAGLNGSGGAILVNVASLTLDRVHVTGNTATQNGGGVRYWSGPGTHRILNSTFSNNHADGSGGGFDQVFFGVTIANSTFSGNSASNAGGAFSHSFGSTATTLRNVTITGNTASSAGGATVLGSLDFGNTIIAGNTATGASPPEIANNGSQATSAGNNLVGDSAGDAANTTNPITYQSTDILDTNPMLGILKNNLGRTPTHSLSANSPAVDKGDNAKAVDPFDNSALATDQRGLPRIVDAPPPPNTATVDIGAFEMQVPSAAGSKIAGIIFSSTDGKPLAGVVLRLDGAASSFTVTDSSGRYLFDDLEQTGFYTLTPQLANYSFSPAVRSFSLLGDKTDADFTAAPDKSPSANPLDTAEFFVRQHYLDFLDREPEQGGLQYWTEQVRKCGADADCVRSRRIAVSAAFFIAQEFQQTGYYVYRFHQASFGSRPSFAQFKTDRSKIVAGPTLEAGKQAFADEWVKRAEFLQAYPLSLTEEGFVGKLFDTAGLTGHTAERQQLAEAMREGRTRAQVLGDVVEIKEFKEREYNRAFVLTQYFGYLKRDPDEGGYAFWLNVLNNREPNNYRGMVCSFVTSAEYQQRFSPLVTHTNAECGH